MIGVQGRASVRASTEEAESTEKLMSKAFKREAYLLKMEASLALVWVLERRCPAVWLYIGNIAFWVLESWRSQMAKARTLKTEGLQKTKQNYMLLPKQVNCPL